MNTESSDISTDRMPPASEYFLRHPVTRYGVAVAFFGAACLLRLGLAGILESKLAYMTFFPAVMVAAWGRD